MEANFPWILRANSVRDRIPVGTRFSAHPDRPWDPVSLLYNGYWVFHGCRGSRGVVLTPPNHHLMQKVLEKSRAIPLLNLRAYVAYKKGKNLLIWSQVRVRREDWFEPAFNVHIPLSSFLKTFLYLPSINSVAKNLFVV